MPAIIKGCLLGLTFAIMIGPAFFALLQTSIHRDFRSAFFFAIGILLSDFLLLVLIYFGATQILGDDPKENVYFSVIGGIVIVIFGTFTFLKKVQQNGSGKKDMDSKPSKPYVYTMKAFAMNTLNPGIWFLWMTIVVSVTANFGADNYDVIYFLMGALMTIFSTDILKAFVAQKLKPLLKPVILTWMNRIVGLILIGFGIFLILRVFVDMESMLRFYESI